MINPNSQDGRILQYLLSGAAITPLEALERFGSFRLSERIREIEKAGYEIEKNWKKIGKKRVMEYRIKRKFQDIGPAFAPKKENTQPLFAACAFASKVIFYPDDDGAKSGFGYDAKNDWFIDTIEAGIVDPTKVERCAIENSVSAAGRFITTFVSIADIPEKK